MRSNSSLPYRTIRAKSVHWAGWELIDGNSVDPIEEVIPGWDYQRSLSMRTLCRFSHETLLEETGLPDGADIQLGASLNCRDTLYSRLLANERLTLSKGDETNYELEFNTDGDLLSGQFVVTVSLLLPEGRPDAAPFVARRRGSRLGEWTWKFSIEGDASRMPMEVVDFEKRLGSGAAPEARWFLHWVTCDLHLPLGRQFRLLINSNHEQFKELVSLNDSVIASMLSCHIASSVICTVLDADGLNINDHDYPEGSLGDTGVDMIRLCFPGRTVGEIRNMRQHYPERFSSFIQAIYWEV